MLYVSKHEGKFPRGGHVDLERIAGLSDYYVGSFHSEIVEVLGAHALMMWNPSFYDGFKKAKLTTGVKTKNTPRKEKKGKKPKAKPLRMSYVAPPPEPLADPAQILMQNEKWSNSSSSSGWPLGPEQEARILAARTAPQGKRYDLAYDILSALRQEGAFEEHSLSGIEGNRTIPTLGNRTRMELFSDLGMSMVLSGRFAEALPVLQRTAWAPGMKRAHNALNALGVALFQLGDHNAAVGAFHQSVQRNPKQSVGWGNLGAVALQAGQLKQA